VELSPSKLPFFIKDNEHVNILLLDDNYKRQETAGNNAMKKAYYMVAIVIVTIIAALLCTFFIADNVVTDAVNIFNVDSGSPSPIHIGTEDVLYADHFSFANQAEIPLVLDYVNITIYISSDYVNITIYISSFPSSDSQYVIGSFSIENEKVDANKQIGFPINFPVTSEGALNQIHSSSYVVGEKIEMTISGSYLFWSFLKQKIITRP
jgi:hypothetical protein